MELTAKVTWLKALKVQFPNCAIEETWRWNNDESYVAVGVDKFTEPQLDALMNIAHDSGAKGSRSLTQKINLVRKLKADTVGTVINSLEGLETALNIYIGASAHHWLFEEMPDGQLAPWYVYRLDRKPASERDGTPAHVTMSCVCCCMNEKVERNFIWHANGLGATVIELLADRCVYLETPEAIKVYESQMDYYKSIGGKTGEQFLAYGRACDVTRRYYGSRGVVEMERDGEPARVVMDNETTDEGAIIVSRDVAVSCAYWTPATEEEDIEKSKRSEQVVTAPVQPYVTIFDLNKHEHIRIHVTNLKPYEYDPTLIDKLVLPADLKDLIGILIEGADIEMEDIVRGKTGGIEIICTGPPGTGKTLTAEVFSEQVHRPLYCVQCSQLGTNEQTLEKTLQLVLGRAARWKAILVVDEADVYIHARNEDIQQNAIVGVWLRLMEHYRGILFMTSNRTTIIDDAILSRATAWIKYDYPDDKNRPKIWRVLSENYKVSLTSNQIEQLSVDFRPISGRTIKNLLRLARLLSVRRGKKVDVPMLNYVSGFIDMEQATPTKA